MVYSHLVVYRHSNFKYVSLHECMYDCALHFKEYSWHDVSTARNACNLMALIINKLYNLVSSSCFETKLNASVLLPFSSKAVAHKSVANRTFG